MLSSLSLTARMYWRAYQQYAIDFWENLTPMQYGIILISVGIVGYLMMKSANK